MTLRINQVAERPAAVTISVDGQELTAFPGESLAAALHAAAFPSLRYSPRAKQPRSAFCFMGVCQECLVLVHKQRVLACQTPVQTGLVVELITDPSTVVER
jgi:NADH dehydrogenase/NADH:ubiquinone oxidoreductase subunit G